jgi:4-hydroxyphenylpyruvate dioxygenase
MVHDDLGTSGLEFIEFATSDSAEAQTLEQVLTALGFVVAGRHRSREVLLFRQGEVNLVLNAEPASFARSYAALHGLSVCAMGLRVADAQEALRIMQAHGAQPYSAKGAQGELDIPAIRGVAGSLIYLVDRFGERGNIYDTDFACRPVEAMRSKDAHLSRVDHIAQTVPTGTTRQWISYYARHFGLSVFEHNYLPDAGGYTVSTVVARPESNLRIILNDSRAGKTHSGQFLKESLGGGVQHIAFRTNDIFRMLDRCRQQGLPLLPVPEAYYRDLVKEGYDPALVDRLKDNGVMMDTVGGGRFLHAYTRPFAGQFFLEIVQREHHHGFGLHDVAYRLRALEGERGELSAAPAPPPILEDLGAQVEASTILTGTITDRDTKIATPAAMGKWCAVHGVDAVWLTFRVAAANLKTFLAAARVLENFNGFTATVDHKAALLPLLDRVSKRARRIGAVNVVRRESDGRFLGDNMEGLGLLEALAAEGVDVRGTAVWLVGAGNTGRAIAWALAEAGVGHLFLQDLHREKAVGLRRQLKAAYRKLPVELGAPAPHTADIAINATPMGLMPDDPVPIEPRLLKADATVADVVLTPPVTHLAAAAEKQGHKVISGRKMLEGQLGLFAEFLGLDS